MSDNHQKIINRLHRIEGQARGIENMVRENKPYSQIIQQLEALRSATNQIITLLIEEKFIQSKNPPLPEDLIYLHRFIKRL